METETMVVIGLYYGLNALVESLPEPKEIEPMWGKVLVKFLNALAGNFRKGITEKYPKLKGK
ncbi:hypothetical protein LCGC14_0928340 [marine sediment metagenome]|uniref:Uncharacterized protein n=1 Tax=marine sediment metagenome TaxID=412755 RepID=A0A0F9NTD2_9ZZZZ